MAVTNAKNNFFARLLGKTSKDKSYYPQQEEPYNPTPTQGTPPSGFVPDYLPNYVGPRTLGAPSQPATQAGSQPTQPSQPQTQAGQPTDQQSGTVGAPNSRYRLMEMIEPKPERDQQAMDIIQRRSKINAIGKGFSALAGLGGIAMGGDAPAMVDLVTPWNMQQMQTLDADYRNRLQDWVNRSFQVDASNNQILNREIDQNIDAENAMERVRLQGENARQLAEQRAQYALQQLQAKSEAEQIKDMESMGINPYAEDAYSQYLNAQKKKFNTDINYTQARTNWNNRPASTGSRETSKEFPYPLATVKKGRDARIAQLEAEKKSALAGAKTTPEKDAISKRYDSMIDDVRKYNPGSNELMDADMAELGYQLEEQELSGGKNTTSNPSNQAGKSQVEFDWNNPERSFTNVSKQDDPVIKSRITSGFEKALTGSLTKEDFMQLSQDLIDAGDAQDLEEAYFFIEKFIEENQQQ